MDIAFVLYPNMTALDLIGPYEVLAGIPGVRPHFVAATKELVRADSGLVLAPTTTFAELRRADIVVVPGSSHWLEALDDEQLITWLREVHPTTKWTTSVCTGSTLLAEAGIVGEATTHWAVRDYLDARGVVVSTERVVRDGKVITAAGVSAGIDMALRLAGEVWGDEVAQTVQLAIEYDPEPPYEYAKIPPRLADRIRSGLTAPRTQPAEPDLAPRA